jgi:hypothetical protein
MKHRAKAIEQNCQQLLINIHRQDEQYQWPESIRFDYLQYLNKRYNDEIERQEQIEQVYDRIEQIYFNYQTRIGTLKTGFTSR